MRESMTSTESSMPDDSLNLLRHLTSSWAGRVVDQDGLVRVLNEHGRRPPLVWCFNAAHEFPVMARSLGHDQPVIGLRSLHMVKRLDGTRLFNDDFFADYYWRYLSSRMDLNGCFVGGNCQGAFIAARIASNMLASGREVRALISMEAQPIRPFPGRVEMIFGADSDFNPFRRGEMPQSHWRRFFAETVVQVIPGAHGEFFSEQYHPGLSKALQDILTRPALNPDACNAQPQAIVEIVDEVRRLPKSVNYSMEIETRTCATGHTTVDDALIAYQWISPEYGLGPMGQQALPMPAGLRVARHALQLTVPDQYGNWVIEFFVCRQNHGPLSWIANRPINKLIQIY